ncbi:MAG TPA: metal-dependent hydrolase [Thermoanaerobaculia bacterium]|nr:metal-dependent hydrolase [Thermoanaerobaculia bacterium]
MPTVLTHPAVPLALGAAAGGDRVGGRLLVAGVIASVLPDADVLGFRGGVPYESERTRRGGRRNAGDGRLAWGCRGALRPRVVWLMRSRPP